jgi:hypothetical protein
MHTIMVIGIGLVMLTLILLAGYWHSGAQVGPLVAKIFIPVWLIAALINMWVGVNSAGYTVAEELPIFLLVFGVPAILSIVLAWQLPKP